MVICFHQSPINVIRFIREILLMEAVLNFHEFGEGPPEWIVENPMTGEPSEFVNLTKTPQVIKLENARDLNLSFENHGVEIIDAASTVTDFYDDHQIDSTYLPEVDELVRRVTGCSSTYIFDVTMRTTDEKTRERYQIRSPANFVHGDFTASGPLNRLKHFLPEKYDALSSGRVAIVNVWRGHVNDVKQKPMAFCLNSQEERDKSIRTIQRTSRHEPDKKVSYIEMASFSESQQWVMFPDMKKSEAVVFKTGDTADPHSGLVHTSCDMVSSENENTLPARHSIECRVLCFWDKGQEDGSCFSFCNVS